MSHSKSGPIVVVGGGPFGLSTVYHLTQAGYYINISVFDKDEDIPSRFSAASDLNKTVQHEYEDPFYTDLTVQAIEAWKTPPFAPHFCQIGFLHCVSEAAPEKAIQTMKRFQAAAERHPHLKK